jgi:uncharacterized protein (TIGR03083 family)
MDYAAHVAAVERELASLDAALRVGPMDATVPTCPDWRLRDLAAHLGEFTALWSHLLCEATGRDKTPFPEVPGDDELPDWYRQLGADLLALLEVTPADTEVWTYVPADQSARFAARRCANELAVHRYDVQTVTGTAEPIEAELAADGIEEIFVMAGARDDPPEGSGRSLHLHSTDRGDEWTIVMGADGLDVRREHARADLALVGAVSDLELLLLQRPPIGHVERHGDEAALDAWYREFTF